MSKCLRPQGMTVGMLRPTNRILRTQDYVCLNNQSIHQKEIIFKVKSCLHDEQQNINPNRCAGGSGKSEPWDSRLLEASEVKCQRIIK